MVTSPRASLAEFKPLPVASLRTHPNRAVVEVVRYESPTGWQFSQQIHWNAASKTTEKMHPNGSSCLIFLMLQFDWYLFGVQTTTYTLVKHGQCWNYPIFKRRLIFIPGPFSSSVKTGQSANFQGLCQLQGGYLCLKKRTVFCSSQVAKSIWSPIFGWVWAIFLW